MTPGYPLDIALLHDALLPWLPAHPKGDELARPNQETVQLFQQLREHGFECELAFRIWRLSNAIGGRDIFQLIPSIEYQSQNFDARHTSPDKVVEQYCLDHDITWREGDQMDEALGVQFLRNLQENSRAIPHLGVYRAIEDALSQMQRERIDRDTQTVEGGKAGGRL